MAMTRMPWLALLAVTLPLQGLGESWSLEASLGDAYNFRTRLRIEQDGGVSRALDADYRTRGSEVPVYYVLRAARWSEDRAWEISVIHHKLFLADPPEGVSAFSVTHGFNILTLNRAARRGPWVARFGAGPVVTHAEGTINGVQYEGSYRLSGAALLAAGGWRFDLGRSVFLSAELMATAAYFRAKMTGPPDATVRGSNVALHALAGIGVELR